MAEAVIAPLGFAYLDSQAGQQGAHSGTLDLKEVSRDRGGAAAARGVPGLLPLAPPRGARSLLPCPPNQPTNSACPPPPPPPGSTMHSWTVSGARGCRVTA